jgi:CHAD domain-containing protein
MAKSRSKVNAPEKPAATTSLSVHLNGRVDELRRMVPRALRSWDAVAIHQSRVTTRRLKAAIDLLEPVLPPARRKRFAKTLRRLRRALGQLRDADVMLGHLDELRARRAHSAAVEWFGKRLQQERLELRRECTREHPPKAVLDGLGAWWGLEQEVAEAEHATQALLRRAAPAQLKAFAGRADRLVRARETTTHGENANERGTDDDVHALRISGKLLRYTLELAAPAGFAVPGSVLRSFKQLQEALGAWHDDVVLGESALRAAMKAQLAAHHGVLYGDVLDLARALWKRSERHLDRFAKLWRAHGESIAERVTQMFAGTPAVPAALPVRPARQELPEAAPAEQMQAAASFTTVGGIV